MEYKRLMPFGLKPTSDSTAENSSLGSPYMHRSSKTELHIPDTILDRIWAAWGNWRRLASAQEGGAGRTWALTYVALRAASAQRHQVLAQL